MTIRRSAVVIGVAAVALLASCGSSSKSSSSPSTAKPSSAGAGNLPTVTVSAHDYGFTLPATMPTGWVNVTLKNTGKQAHQLAFVKLGSVPYAQFTKAAATTDVKSLSSVVFVGGPNNADPGQSVTATVHFDPGTYGVACFIPAPDGKPHAAHGMVGKVVAQPAANSVQTAPTATAGTITTSEFTFLVSTDFTGKGVVKFTNAGTQVHEVIIDKIASGKTLTDVKKFLLAKSPSETPPVAAAGGVVGIGPKQTAYQNMTLSAGNYVLLCFFPDPTKGNIPHVFEGMIKEITVS